jgi:hypothetical protein
MREDYFDETEAADSGEPARLLVSALRAMALGHDDCPALAHRFTRACGRLGTPALHAYFVLVKCIGAASRRRLQVHLPGCPCISFDEAAIVGVVAAAQAALRDEDCAILRMRLRFLVGGEPDRHAVFAAHAVARIFALSGLHLPPQTCAGAGLDQAPDPGPRVVH